MQRLCEVRGGVSAYLRNPDMLVTESTRKCPFCENAYELSLRGKLTIGKDFAGQTLEIQPLTEEEEKKQLPVQYRQPTPAAAPASSQP